MGMGKVIAVCNLKRDYDVFVKPKGSFAYLRSVFGRKYQKVKAVGGISFSISQGELVGFIGPNGAGKTTTLKCLSGLLVATSGKVRVLGFDPFLKQKEFLKKISLVMGQKNQLWWNLPAIETFLLNKEIYEIEDNDFKKRLNELVNLLEVEDLINVPTRKLSLGERMKCELIASLIHQPEVLFLDEPTIGLDVVMQEKIREFIKIYNERYKSTIILTSHYMEDVKKLAKRVIIIDKGKIIYDGDLAEIVEKYADYKVISVVFDGEVDGREVEKLGELISFSYPAAVLKVKRSRSNFVASELLSSFAILDLNVEEPEISSVIRDIFKREKRK